MMIKEPQGSFFIVLLAFRWRSAGARYTRVEARKNCSEAGNLFIYKYLRSWKLTYL